MDETFTAARLFVKSEGSRNARHAAGYRFERWLNLGGFCTLHALFCVLHCNPRQRCLSILSQDLKVSDVLRVVLIATLLGGADPAAEPSGCTVTFRATPQNSTNEMWIKTLPVGSPEEVSGGTFKAQRGG